MTLNLRPSRTQSIYFVRRADMEGPIKIGCTFDVTTRLQQLMSWSPVDLAILFTMSGDFAIEGRIHHRFGSLHLRHEWFSPGDELLVFLSNLQSGIPLEDATDWEVTGKSIHKPKGMAAVSAERRRAIGLDRKLWRVRRDYPGLDSTEADAAIKRVQASADLGKEADKSDLALIDRFLSIATLTASGLTAAKRRCGGNSGLSRGLGGITPQAVSQWKRVPVDRVLDVERLTGVPRHQLRPDIYPAPEPMEIEQ